MIGEKLQHSNITLPENTCVNNKFYVFIKKTDF